MLIVFESGYLKQRPTEAGKIPSGVQKLIKAGPESLTGTGEMITLLKKKKQTTKNQTREILSSNLKKKFSRCRNAKSKATS